jgi:hypothetical protein
MIPQIRYYTLLPDGRTIRLHYNTLLCNRQWTTVDLVAASEEERAKAAFSMYVLSEYIHLVEWHRAPDWKAVVKASCEEDQAAAKTRPRIEYYTASDRTLTFHFTDATTVSVVAEAAELCAKAAAGLYCLEEHPLEEHTAMKRRKEEAKSRSR